MELIIIIVLIFFNGIFSMLEMALVSSSKFKLENEGKKGNKGAKIALNLSENPTKFLSTIQIGITLISILLGVYSGEILTSYVESFLSKYDYIKPYSNKIAISIIVVFITYISIVFGELLPKRIGMTFPEPIAILFAKTIKIFLFITAPFVWILTTTNDLNLKILGIKKTNDNIVSEDEIRSILKESANSGEIQDIEQNIVEKVFELGDLKVNSLFTHRSNIVFFDIKDTLESIKAKINNGKHSVYPVCENNNLDSILGIVFLKDLFSPELEKDFNLSKIIKEPLYLNEVTFAYKVLELFKKKKMHYGIVIDEYGTTKGIITMNDVISVLVGETIEIEENDYKIIQKDTNSWLVDGQYSIIDFKKYFNLSIIEENENNFTTVAGLIINTNNYLPNIGEKFTFNEYEIEVINKKGQRIDKLLVTKNNTILYT